MGDLGTGFGTTFGSGLLANGDGPPDGFRAAAGCGTTRGVASGLAMAALAGAFGRAGGATALGAAVARVRDLPGWAAALAEGGTFAAGLALATGRAPAFAAGAAMRRAAETCLAFAAGRAGLAARFAGPDFTGPDFTGPDGFLRADFPDGLARAGAFIPDQSPATAVAPAADRSMPRDRERTMTSARRSGHLWPRPSPAGMTWCVQATATSCPPKDIPERYGWPSITGLSTSTQPRS